MNTIETLDPNVFKHLIVTIGALPTSFIDSMSYYEMIAWLVNYIKTEVVPAVNNNAEAVAEIQQWISTLDLQDEVDNKLDEMAESGELADIIAQYLQLAGVLVYKTIADMSAAENLADGSIARVLGNTNYAAGDGAYYLIRQLINTDVIDGVNLVAITNAPTLVAERITDGNLNAAVATLNNSISAVNTRIDNIINEKVLMIGDSYGVGTTSGGTTTGWCDKLKDLMGLADADYTKLVEGGAGFKTTGESGHTFLTLLQANIGSIANKDKYKKIIVCGGYNDHPYTSSQLNPEIQAFLNYCKQQFVNAKVYVGMIGNSGANTEAGAGIRTKLSKDVLRAYQNTMVYGGVYLNGVENIMHDYRNFMSADNTHPNELGYNWLGGAIYNALVNGYADYKSESNPSIINFPNTNNSTTFNITTRISNDVVDFTSPSTSFVYFTNAVSVGQNLTLGTIDLATFRPTNDQLAIPCGYYLMTNNSQFYGGYGFLLIKKDGTLEFSPNILKNDGSAYPTIQNVTTIAFRVFNYTAPTVKG